MFAGDGQLISQWVSILEAADVPSTMIVGTHRAADVSLRLHENSPGFDPERFAAHERFFVEDIVQTPTPTSRASYSYFFKSRSGQCANDYRFYQGSLPNAEPRANGGRYSSSTSSLDICSRRSPLVGRVVTVSTIQQFHSLPSLLACPRDPARPASRHWLR